jgi:hypothetical protein
LLFGGLLLVSNEGLLWICPGGIWPPEGLLLVCSPSLRDWPGAAVCPSAIAVGSAGPVAAAIIAATSVIANIATISVEFNSNSKVQDYLICLMKYFHSFKVLP